MKSFGDYTFHSVRRPEWMSFELIDNMYGQFITIIGKNRLSYDNYRRFIALLCQAIPGAIVRDKRDKEALVYVVIYRYTREHIQSEPIMSALLDGVVGDILNNLDKPPASATSAGACCVLS